MRYKFSKLCDLWSPLPSIFLIIVLFTFQLFDKLRNEQPSRFDKLIPVLGNVSYENLGLQPVDRQVLVEKVSIVYHAAANVRFDESLKSAIFSNTRSTRDICKLAQDMKKLVVSVCEYLHHNIIDSCDSLTFFSCLLVRASNADSNTWHV